MYSFPDTNSSRKLVDNDRTIQRNETVTSRHNMAFYEDDTKPIQDMNFTLLSTLRATGATTSTSGENISMSTENYRDFRYSNVSLAISKVKKSVWYFTEVGFIFLKYWFTDHVWHHIKSYVKFNATNPRRWRNKSILLLWGEFEEWVI